VIEVLWKESARVLALPDFKNRFEPTGSVLVAFAVPEFVQGAADLNGDGDALDSVLHVYDHRTGVVTNLGLATSNVQPAIAEGFVAFAVLEAAQGEEDLDGDGTILGSVLHVYDSRTLLAYNAARHVSSAPVFLDHGYVFTTDEVLAGDRNEDGDSSDDSVLQFFDVIEGSIVDVPYDVLGTPLSAHHEWWVLLVSEAGQGSDLNADGDQLDGVYHQLDPHVMVAEPLGLSSNRMAGSAGTHDHMALITQEIDGLDRNEDGDLLDSILALYDPHAASVFDTGLAIDVGAAGPVVLGERVAVGVREDDHALDLNSDGDLDDVVVHVIDPELKTLDNLKLDAVSLQAFGEWLAIGRDEEHAGLDWNGDGDQDDQVVFLWDVATEVLTNTRLSCTGRAIDAADESLLLIGLERGERRDLNGDGDQDDHVLMLHDLATHANRSLGRAVALSQAGLTPDGRGVCLVYENWQGEDLNRDGDREDSVLHALR